MREISWENYLRWVIEVTNQCYEGNIKEFNNAVLGMDK